MPTTKIRISARTRREKVKTFILDYWRKNCSAPTHREIAQNFGTSTSVVNSWLIKFEREGWMTPRRAGLARTIIPIDVMRLLGNLKVG